MMSEKQTWSTLVKRLIGWLNAKAGDPRPDDPLIVGHLFPISFDARHTAAAIRVAPHVLPDRALAALNLPPVGGVVVIHGGAGQMEPQDMALTRQFLIASVAPLAEKHRLLIVDGGTQTGTAQILGEAREAINGTFPLVGVVPEGCVTYPAGPTAPDAAPRIPLNAAHSHFIFVQASEFGAESPLMVGLLGAAGKPGAAFVINGGDTVLSEIRLHSQQNNPVITLAGSGRMADLLADPTSAERQQLPSTARLHVAHITDPQGSVQLLTRVLRLPV